MINNNKEKTIVEVYTHNKQITGVYAVAMAIVKNHKIIESNVFAVKATTPYKYDDFECCELSIQALKTAPTFEELYAFIRHYFYRDVISYNVLVRDWIETSARDFQIKLPSNYQYINMDIKTKKAIEKEELSKDSMIKRITKTAEIYKALKLS